MRICVVIIRENAETNLCVMNSVIYLNDSIEHTLPVTREDGCQNQSIEERKKSIEK